MKASLLFAGICLIIRITALSACATTRYVSLSGNHILPFTSWANAATNIQDAVNVSSDDDVILITNGMYYIYSPVVITNSLYIKSVHDAEVTIIDAKYSLQRTRCFTLKNPDIHLEGFTVTGGNAQDGSTIDQYGGGIYSENGAFIKSCIIVSNSSRQGGNGIYLMQNGSVSDCSIIGNGVTGVFNGAGGIHAGPGSVVSNCVISFNEGASTPGVILSTNSALINCTVLENYTGSGYGGGVRCYSNSVIDNCIISRNQCKGYGAGVYCINPSTIKYSTISENSSISYAGRGGGVYLVDGTEVINCKILNNTPSRYGGGLYFDKGGVARNCIVSGNICDGYSGGGAYMNEGGTLESCTISGNSGSSPGVYIDTTGTVVNSIVYHNGSFGYSQIWGDMNNASVSYTCSWPQPDGTGNIDDDPLFLDQNAGVYYVFSNSPCINSGIIQSWMSSGTDIDGNPRIIDGYVDMGAYEYGSFACSFVADKTYAKESLHAIFTSYVTGTNQNDLYYYWDIDNDGSFDYQGADLNSISNTYGIGSWSVRLVVENHIGEQAEHIRRDYIVVTPVRTIYASLDGGHIPPFTQWSTAATNIQDAIDQTVDGDIVVVSNGLWVLNDTLKIKNNITFSGLNGYGKTFIDGNNLVRCISSTNKGAIIEGFTFQNGNDFYDTVFFGGAGVLLERGTVRRCVIRNNWSRGTGGGLRMYGSECLVENCMIYGNYSVEFGGGVYISSGNIKNCTIIGNDAYAIGGVYSSSFLGKVNDPVENTIIYYNTSRGKISNYDLLDCYYCCSYPKPDGPGCIDTAPGLVGLDNFYLVPGAACINSGDSSLVHDSVDIEGNPRISGSAVDMGCREFGSGTFTGSLSVSVTANFSYVATGFSVEFSAFVEGIPKVAFWNFGDGNILSNSPMAYHSFDAAGAYPVIYAVINDSGSASATVTVHVTAVTNYVSSVGLNIPPYTSWNNAAHVIQDAVDAAPVGGTVLVAPGVYNTGMRVAVLHEEATTNRVVVAESVKLIATNKFTGDTIITGLIHGNNSNVRGVFLENNSLLSGFVVSNCSTRMLDEGGGVYSHGGMVTNCIIAHNEGLSNGGGVYSDWEGLVVDSVITYNEGKNGGGVAGGYVKSCLIAHNEAIDGGGAAFSYVTDSYITNNSASSDGGGLSDSEAYSCVISGNDNGGAYYHYYGNIESCTITKNNDYGIKLDNLAYFWYLTCSVYNCVIQFNYSNNWVHAGDGKTWFENCCTEPMPLAGADNFTNDPLFVNASADNFRLTSSSPCIDSGVLFNWMYQANDLDGNPRIIGDSVDIGAYEFTPDFWCSFFADKTQALPDEEITFLATTSESDISSIFFRWDFDNDGTIDVQGFSSNTPAWYYQAEGVYSVYLCISNMSGNTSESLRANYIDIIPEPLCIHFIVLVIALILPRRRHGL